MSTLAALKSRIADELARTDLNSQIAQAVSEAIYDYQSTRFSFNQARESLSTVADQEFYTSDDLPGEVIEIDSIRATINGRTYQLAVWGYQELDRIASTTNTTGQPLAWAWYAEELRLYPVPDGAYTLTISYHKRIDAPSDAEENVWTNEKYAGQLIRYSALRRIALDYLKDDAEGAKYAQGESVQLRRLGKESRQLSTGCLVGSM